MKVLVTGGAGYIGSHTCVELLAAGHEVVIVDNFCNSSPEAVRRIEEVGGAPVTLVEADIRNRGAMRRLFADHAPEAVLHFAGFKAVGESVEQPVRYYDTNLGGTAVLCDNMREAGVKTLVFSSSATVYGQPERVPITEDSPLGPTNPYGRSKLMVEQMLGDLQATGEGWRIALLRYFNPVGAHPSGRLGEDPSGVPNNLMPFVCQVAVGRRDQLNVFGDDYPTPDGTGVRDYIHVVDLAKGHLAALETLEREEGRGDEPLTVNLGTGRGYSVIELIRAFEHASGRPIPYRIAPRRSGDVAQCYADPSRAEQLMGWRVEYGLAKMCEDAWRWQAGNPNGYAAEPPQYQQRPAAGMN